MLENYIMVVKNALSDKLCEEIIKEYENAKEWKPTVVGYGEYKEVRNCDGICISEPEIIKDNLVRKSLDDQVHGNLTKAIEKYFKKFNYALCSRDSGYDLLRYSVGGKYIEHVDYTPNYFRCLTVSFVLNDGYKGGNFSFFGNTNVYELKKGECIIFPSNFMFPHAITPITEGTRYSIVTWMY
jgi:hypothetical protein